MVSAESLLAGLFLMLLSVPFLLFPRRAARLRLRHARDPEPTAAGVRDARLGGAILFVFGVFVLLAL
jgi:hypothetical protein